MASGAAFTPAIAGPDAVTIMLGGPGPVKLRAARPAGGRRGEWREKRLTESPKLPMNIAPHTVYTLSAAGPDLSQQEVQMGDRILFVVEESDLLNDLQRMLVRQRGAWRMRFAHSAQEAVEAARHTDFDAVIADGALPGEKGGPALLEALRADEGAGDVPVIILAGAEEEDLPRRAIDLGAFDLLAKPVNREELLARIANALRVKSYQERPAPAEGGDDGRAQELVESRREMI